MISGQNSNPGPVRLLFWRILAHALKPNWAAFFYPFFFCQSCILGDTPSLHLLFPQPLTDGHPTEVVIHLRLLLQWHARLRHGSRCKSFIDKAVTPADASARLASLPSTSRMPAQAVKSPREMPRRHDSWETHKKHALISLQNYLSPCHETPLSTPFPFCPWPVLFLH